MEIKWYFRYSIYSSIESYTVPYKELSRTLQESEFTARLLRPVELWGTEDTFDIGCVGSGFDNFLNFVALLRCLRSIVLMKGSAAGKERGGFQRASKRSFQKYVPPSSESDRRKRRRMNAGSHNVITEDPAPDTSHVPAEKGAVTQASEQSVEKYGGSSSDSEQENRRRGTTNSEIAIAEEEARDTPHFPNEGVEEARKTNSVVASEQYSGNLCADGLICSADEPEVQALSVFNDSQFPSSSLPDESDFSKRILNPSSEVAPVSGSGGDEEDDLKFPICEEYILALLLTTGTARLTRDQYDSIRTILNQRNSEKRNFPTYSTVQKNVRPFALRHMYAKSCIKLFPVEHSKAGASDGVGSYHQVGHAPVRIVKPSEWAKKDFRSTKMRKVIWKNPKGRNHPFGIGNMPIVKDRSNSLAPFANKSRNGTEHKVTKGMFMEVVCPRTDVLETSLEALGMKTSTTGEMVSFTARISSVEHIHDQECVGNNESYFMDPKHFRNGDVIAQVKCRRGNAALNFRALKSDRGGDYRQRLICMDPENHNTVWFPIQDVFAISPESEECKNGLSSSGTLQCGRKYFIYHFLLYNDGFTPNNRNGSMDGCYIIPLGIPPEQRTPSGALRRLFLCPPGISSKTVMPEVVDDIVEGSKGIVLNDSGEEVVLFLDCVAYIGDFPAVSEMCSVMGHNAKVPCHLCMFKRRDIKEGPSFTGIINQDSGNIAIRRSHVRCKAIMKSNVGQDGLKQVGLKLSTYPSPFHALSERLDAVRKHIPKNDKGVPVIHCGFDVYRSTLISPDHVFLGISQNIINACLLVLTPLERSVAETLSVDIVTSNGISITSHLFNKDKSGLKPLTISEVYSVLLFFPDVLRSTYALSTAKEGCKMREQLLDIVTEFSRLVSDTLYRPMRTQCGKEVVSETFFTDRIPDLRRRAQRIVRMMTECCRDPDIRNVLDKPNVHRLVEMFQHTLPLCPNIHFILELILERGHQELKRGIKQSNFKNPQLQAMESSLANDWKCRVHEELKLASEEKTSDNLRYLFGLRTMEDDGLKKLCTEELLQNFKTQSTAFCNFEILSVWEGRSPMKIPSKAGSFVTKCSRFLIKHLHQSACKEGRASTISSILRMGSARWSRKDSLGQEVGISMKLEEGSVFQTFSSSTDLDLREAQVKVLQPGIDGQRIFLLCHGFIQISERNAKGLFTICSIMDVCDENQSTYTTGNADPSILVKMDALCRPVLKIHACWNNSCYVDGSEVLHRSTGNGGSQVVLKGREEGYPSRST